MQARQQLKTLCEIILQIPWINEEGNAEAKTLLQEFGSRFLAIANGCSDKQLVVFVSSVKKHCESVVEHAKKAEVLLKKFTDTLKTSSKPKQYNDIANPLVTLQKQLVFAFQSDILSIFTGTPLMIEQWENTLLKDNLIESALKKLLEIIVQPPFFYNIESEGVKIDSAHSELKEEMRIENVVSEIKSEEFEQTSRQFLLDEFGRKFKAVTLQKKSHEELSSFIVNAEEYCKNVVAIAKRAIIVLQNYTNMMDTSSHIKQLILAYQEDILCVFKTKYMPFMMYKWGNTVLRDNVVRFQLKEILNILLKLSALKNDKQTGEEVKVGYDVKPEEDEEFLRNEFKEKFKKIIGYCTNKELQRFADEIQKHYEEILSKQAKPRDSSVGCLEKSVSAEQILNSTLNFLHKLIVLKDELDGYLQKSEDGLIGRVNAKTIRKTFKKILVQDLSTQRLKVYVSVIATLAKVDKLQLKKQVKEKIGRKEKRKLVLKTATTERILSDIMQEQFDKKTARIAEQSRELMKDLHSLSYFEAEILSAVKEELNKAYEEACDSKSIFVLKACYSKQFADKFDLLAEKGSELIRKMEKFNGSEDITLIKKELRLACEQARLLESVKLIKEFIEKYSKIYKEHQLVNLKQQALNIVSKMRMFSFPTAQLDAAKGKLEAAYAKACDTNIAAEAEELIGKYNHYLEKNTAATLN